MNSYLLPYANITWQTDSTPYAAEFDDIYWSTSGGLNEKRHVFLEGCQLTQRWAELADHDRFTIIETGFGFGLNFLLTLAAWRKTGCGDRGARLEFLSFEKHLVPIEEIATMAKTFGLEAELKLVKDKYPLPLPGSHIMQLTDNVCLTLVVGAAEEAINSLSAEADAVFLDGFSPSRNESLWQRDLVTKLTQKLRPGGILSTYSVAGSLRRDLSDAGLVVQKAEGYGNKRHMLIAVKPGLWQPKSNQVQTIGVIGAGLSGLFLARSLSTLGHKVILIDESGEALGAVREIRQIAIYPQLSQTPQPYSNLYLRAFEYFKRHQEFNQCGRLELLDNREKIQRAERLAEQLGSLLSLMSAAEASALLGFRVSHPGLFTSSAGWLSPASLSRHIHILPRHVKDLKPLDSGWQLKFTVGSITVDKVVLAPGAAPMAPLLPLKLMALRGQSLSIEKTDTSPNCVFSHEKTWFPQLQGGQTTLSGTYSRFDTDTTSREADTEELLSAIRDYGNPEHYSTQVGIRCASRDRLPVLGPLPNWQSLANWLQENTAGKGSFDMFNDYQPGLFCSVGFGSHAGTLGPFAAELLTRIIDGGIYCENLNQLSSIRFAVRDGAL